MQHLVTRQKPSTRVGQPSVIPSSPQQENDKEVREWAEQWGVGVCLPQVTWPSTSCAPPEPTTARLIKAIHNFLEGTALGTDRYHPRFLLRLNPVFLDTLIKVFILCETLGVWPSAITDALIALLPKRAGGRCPIGTFPSLVRISLRLCGHAGVSPLGLSRTRRSYGVFFCACSMASCVCSSRDVSGNR